MSTSFRKSEQKHPRKPPTVFAIPEEGKTGCTQQPGQVLAGSCTLLHLTLSRDMALGTGSVRWRGEWRIRREKTIKLRLLALLRTCCRLLTRLPLRLSPYWADAQYCVIRAVRPRMLRGALWFCALFCALYHGTWRWKHVAQATHSLMQLTTLVFLNALQMFPA